MGTYYEFDTNDKRLTDVKKDEKTELNNIDKTYDGMINKSDDFYNDLIDNSKKWEKDQKKNQQYLTKYLVLKKAFPI